MWFSTDQSFQHNYEFLTSICSKFWQFLLFVAYDRLMNKQYSTIYHQRKLCCNLVGKQEERGLKYKPPTWWSGGIVCQAITIITPGYTHLPAPDQTSSFIWTLLPYGNTYFVYFQGEKRFLNVQTMVTFIYYFVFGLLTFMTNLILDFWYYYSNKKNGIGLFH